ncbi:hypothetical protein [Neomoorella thermoacetica]|uniref:Citrate synthase n=1 Tax=Moorella thermoacetica Y72 TaxID=1325331 RepID=A0A0S6UD45_NEOTH|nr:hypothetical protein [Moorella thermoacetica]GAF25449.1 citrate synthase [Moorella thermoacetica Y72]
MIYRIKDPRIITLLDLAEDIIAREIAETMALMEGLNKAKGGK